MGRNTMQQEIICQTVKSMHNHPSPDQVYNEIHKQHPSIGRATVYRVLNKLADKGELNKVCIPGTADRFDFRTDDHIHMVCSKCNKVYDADFDGIHEPLHQFSRAISSNCSNQRSGFKVNGIYISLHGVCEECSSKSI